MDNTDKVLRTHDVLKAKHSPAPDDIVWSFTHASCDVLLCSTWQAGCIGGLSGFDDALRHFLCPSAFPLPC